MGKLLAVNITTRRELRDTLREGYLAGEGIPQLATRVESIYSAAEGYRSEMIARTEIISAANAGSVDGMKESGVVDKKEWIATLDGRERDEHGDASGQIVDLDGTFDIGGEDLDYPGDPSGSAEMTINCRCAVAPVMKEDLGGEAND
jgi:SPP1 gp7 family putative phage head morphogenesis protein